jgi:HEAT repeat protein
MEESFEAVLKTLGALALPESQDQLYVLSDLDHAQTVRLMAAWPTVPPGQRLRILEFLGDLARDHVALNFDQVDRIALSDQLPGVRRQAILNLWESEDPELARPFLAALTGDSAAEVRSAAAQALGLFVYLGELGRLPESLRRSVEDALLRSSHADEDEGVRLHSIESLGYSSREEVSTLIREAYATGREGLQRSALVAMGRSANEVWSPSVTAQLTSPSPALRLESARAAGELEIRSAVPGLLELLEDVNPEVRQAAAWSLGQLGGPQAVRALTRLLDAAEDPGEVRQLTDALDHLAFVEGTRRIGMPELDEDWGPTD